MGKALSQFKKEFLERTIAAREGRYTQQEMADLLGISQSRYSKWEIRTLVPHAFVGPFCVATGRSAGWLFGVEGAVPKRRKRATRRGRGLDSITATPVEAG